MTYKEYIESYYNACCSGLSGKKKKKQLKKFHKQVRKTGIAECETWNLDWVYAAWLHSMVKEYYKRAKEIVDLTYHTYTYKGKERTQEWCIKKIIKYTDTFLEESEKISAYEDSKKYLTKASELFTLILSDMWW